MRLFIKKKDIVYIDINLKIILFILNSFKGKIINFISLTVAIMIAQISTHINRVSGCVNDTGRGQASTISLSL